MDRDPTSQPALRRTRLRRGLRLGRRIGAWLALAVVALVVAVVLLLLVAPGRQFLLQRGLDLAGRELPGELRAGRLAWPRLGELSLADLLWIAPPDTLARIDRLRLAVSLGELRRRDLLVEAAWVEGAWIDLPAIQARLAAHAESTGELPGEQPAGTPLYLRAGSLPPLPSLAIERLRLERIEVATTPGQSARLDSLDLALDLRRDRPPRLALGLRARPLATLGATWRLRGEARDDTLVLALSPLTLAEPSRLPAAVDLPLDGRLRLPLATARDLLAGRTQWPALAIEQLAVAGDAGAWRLDASLDGRAPGRLTLASEMPAAPVSLLGGLAALAGDTTVTRARLDTLAARWGRHGPPRVDLAIDLRPPPAGGKLAQAGLEASGRFQLPAPWAVAPLLPRRLMADDLGPIHLDLTATYDGTREPAALALDLDLGRTRWLDRATIVAAGDRASLTRAEIELRLPGLALTAAGRADRDSFALEIDLDLPDGKLLRRWRDPALLALDLRARARARANGRWSAPRASLEAAGAIRSPAFAVPSATLAAVLSPDTLHVELALPDGWHGETLDLSGLQLSFAGTAGDSLRRLNGLLALEAAAPPAAVSLRGRLAADGLFAAPEVTFHGERLHLSLDRRHLTSAGPWLLNATAADTAACISGLRLAGSLGHLDLEACVRADSLDASLDLDLQVILDSLRPLLGPGLRDRLPSGTLTAQGRLQAAGTPADPWAGGELRLGVADRPDLADLGAALALNLGGRGTAPAGLDPGPLGWLPRSARAELAVHERGAERVRLQARIPWPLQGAVPDSVDLRLMAAGLPLGRLEPLLPAGLTLSGRLDARTRVHGPLPADLAERAAAGDLDPRRDLDLHLEGDLALDDVVVVLADSSHLALQGALELQGSTRAPLIDGDLHLRGDLGQFDLTATAQPDSAHAEAEFDLLLASETLRPYLPAEHRALLPQGRVNLAGRLRAAGRPEAPWIDGTLRLRATDRPDLAALAASLEVGIGGRDGPPPALATARPDWSPRSARLRLALLDGDAELLRVTVRSPLPHLQSEPDSLDVRLVADRLDLARLGPLLPPGTTLSGRLDAATRLAGLVEPGSTDPDLELGGRLEARGVRLQLPEGSRLAVRGEMDLAGTSRAPIIRGGLHVEGGLIRLPDPPPALLPTAGEALLWRSAAVAPAAGPEPAAPVDPTADPAAESAAEPTDPAAADQAAVRGSWPRVLPDLAFNLTSPGGLWLRGQGLDVELAGDLALLLRGDRIAVEGELQAVQGTMRQLGHVFRLERGRVIFDGSETELNPELDLALAVRVGTYRIEIQVGGTAASPTLAFASEPELGEADILATLLFGKPLEELDEGQTGLLAARATQIAAAYGAVRLQESLARGLGIDVVSIAPREGDEETTALTVGKYLHPRVLVRYEQLLREGSAFFVHLDYAFAGAFRLHTQVSQGEESGLQLKWQRDW